MTPAMRAFLIDAAQCEPGKGLLVPKHARRIAGKAVNDGYGWMITAPLPIFIIDDNGRAAIRSTP